MKCRTSFELEHHIERGNKLPNNSEIKYMRALAMNRSTIPEGNAQMITETLFHINLYL